MSSTTKLPSLPLPTFDGSDLEAFLKSWERWLQLCGLLQVGDEMKKAWLIEASTPKVKKIVESLCESNETLFDVLQKLETLFPKLKNDLTIRVHLEKIASLPPTPDPSQVAQLCLELEENFAKLSDGAISEQEKFLVLLRKIHPKFFVKFGPTGTTNQGQTTTKVCEKFCLKNPKRNGLRKTLSTKKKALLHPLNEATPMITDAKQKYPETFQKVPTRQYEPIKPSEGRGKGKGKGGPSKKPQKDQRTPSHFTVTLECKYCGRKGHYEDECWTKEKDERKRQQSSGKSGRPSGDHPGRTPRRTPSKPPTNSQNPAQNFPMPQNTEGNKKRKADAIQMFNGPQKTYSFAASINGKQVVAFLDTGATISAVSARVVQPDKINRGQTIPLMVGNGQTLYTLGTTNVDFCLGNHHFTQKAHVVETSAFEAILGTDFMETNQKFEGFLVRPPRLLIQGEEIPCSDHSPIFTVQKLFRMFVTESYTLEPTLRESAMRQLDVPPNSVTLDLFASHSNHQEAKYLTRKNSAWNYDWSKIAEHPEKASATPQPTLWANPPFSKLPEVVTKACLEPTRMILVHPDWEDNYWSPLLNEITVHRAQIPSGTPVYLTERTKKPLPAPLWNTQVSLLDTTVKTIPLERLNPKLVRWLNQKSKKWGYPGTD